MSEPKKRIRKDNKVSSLSSVEVVMPLEDKDEISNIKETVFSSLNNKELEKALDSWLKNYSYDEKVALRDLSLLKSIIAEYMDVFLLFGYNLKGERVIIQNFKNARDRDAIMEFLKTIFIKQQQDSFLDSDE